MRSRSAQVAEQLGVGAAGVFEGVGEKGEAVERSFVVDRLCKTTCPAFRNGAGNRVQWHYAEGQWSEDIA
jgi:hypothetical protein